MPPNSINYAGEMRLYAPDGGRYYLTESERVRFIDAARNMPPMARLFCLTLVFTGCRISEARFLRRGDVQLKEQRIAIKTLKRRKQGHIREVPIPEDLVREFMRMHFIDMHNHDEWLFSDDHEGPPPRISCYRWVKTAMSEAGIKGAQACPKGLRHGYGVHATQRGVQLHMLQKWMGHAHMSTTAIYATALGPEELEVAARMW